MRKKIAHSSKDFDDSLLPVTRGKQVLYLYKSRFGIIVGIGLTLLLFSIPLIVFMVMNDLALSNIDPNDAKALAFNNFIFQIFIVVYLLIYSVAVSAVSNVIRTLLYSEGVFFFRDLFKGIKENILNNSLITLMYGIIYLLAYFVMMITNFNALGLIPYILFFIVFVPSYLWVIAETTFYKNNVFSFMKNSFFFLSKNILLTYALAIGFLLPAICVFFKHILVKICIIVVYEFLIMPLFLFIFYSISLNSFDKHVNSENYPEIYRKGLYDPSKDIL